MLTRTRSPLLALLLVLITGSAAADNGFYVFGAAGTALSSSAYDIFNAVDDTETGYFVGAGYAINRHFSVEAAYLDFGTHQGETDCPPDLLCLIVPAPARADLTGYSISLIGSIPLGERWALYGKAGLARWDIEFHGFASDFDRSWDDRLPGASLKWSVSDRWKLLAEYSDVVDELAFAGVGASYRF